MQKFIKFINWWNTIIHGPMHRVDLVVYKENKSFSFSMYEHGYSTYLLGAKALEDMAYTKPWKKIEQSDLADLVTDPDKISIVDVTKIEK